jgi:hypothetical protein
MLMLVDISTIEFYSHESMADVIEGVVNDKYLHSTMVNTK